MTYGLYGPNFVLNFVSAILLKTSTVLIRVPLSYLTIPFYTDPAKTFRFTVGSGKRSVESIKATKLRFIRADLSKSLILKLLSYEYRLQRRCATIMPIPMKPIQILDEWDEEDDDCAAEQEEAAAQTVILVAAYHGNYCCKTPFRTAPCTGDAY